MRVNDRFERGLRFLVQVFKVNGEYVHTRYNTRCVISLIPPHCVTATLYRRVLCVLRVLCVQVMRREDVPQALLAAGCTLVTHQASLTAAEDSP